jgi:hypothetical protein
VRELANGSLLLQILIIGSMLIAFSSCTQTMITPEKAPVMPEAPIDLCEKSEKRFEFDDIGNDMPNPCKLMLARR